MPDCENAIFVFVSGTSGISLHLFFFFGPCLVVYGILVPRPGMEPGSPAAKAQSPNHWTAMEFLAYHYVMAVDEFCRIYWGERWRVMFEFP